MMSSTRFWFCDGPLHGGLLCFCFQSASFSSVTDSTMSLNIVTVTLDMGECGLGRFWVRDGILVWVTELP